MMEPVPVPTEPNPGNSWFSPATIIAILAGVAAWVGVWRAWRQSKDAQASAEQAREAATEATNQDTFRNLAAKAIADALEKQAGISAAAGEAVAEHTAATKKLLALEEAKAIREVKEQSRDFAATGKFDTIAQSMEIHIVNTSPKLEVTITGFAIRLGNGSKPFQLDPTYLSGPRTLAMGLHTDIGMNLEFLNRTPGSVNFAREDNARLCLKSTHADWQDVDDTNGDVRHFLDACVAWMDFRQNGVMRGGTYKGQMSGPFQIPPKRAPK